MNMNNACASPHGWQLLGLRLAPYYSQAGKALLTCGVLQRRLERRDGARGCWMFADGEPGRLLKAEVLVVTSFND